MKIYVDNESINEIKAGILKLLKKFDNQIIANENNKAIIKGIIRLAQIYST
jgi:EAL domain-containing protein (putative c-di-GMP-specific phosphodiesterase class I)